MRERKRMEGQEGKGERKSMAKMSVLHRNGGREAKLGFRIGDGVGRAERRLELATLRPASALVC